MKNMQALPWVSGFTINCSRLLRADFRYTSIAVLLALFFQTNSAQALTVAYDYTLDYATNDQNTYGTGPTAATMWSYFFGIDTGPNVIKFGDIGSATFLGLDLGKYGLEVNGNFDLRTGFELATRNDSGTIDASQSFLSTLTYENQHAAGSFASFTTTQKSLIQSMQTTFPNVGLDIDFVFELDDNYLNVKGCFVDCGTLSLIPPTNVFLDVPVFDYNRDINGDGAPDGLVEFFGIGLDEEFYAFQTEDGSTTVAGGGVTTKPSATLNLEITKGITLASGTVEVPQPHTQNSETLGDSILESGAKDGFVSFFFDVDSWITAAIPPPAGKVIRAINSGSITIPYTDFGLTWDLLNFGPEWDIGYSQEFTLESVLSVDLEFSLPVLVYLGGFQWIDSWQGLWSDLPEFTLLHTGTVDVTPTFDLNATLRNLTELTHDLKFVIEFLKLAYDIGVSSGNVALFSGEYGGEIARSPVFDDTFALEGWNSVAAAPFAVSFTQIAFTETSACQAVRYSYDHYANIWGGQENTNAISPERKAYFALWTELLNNLEQAHNQCNDTTIPTVTPEVCDTQQAWLQNASDVAVKLHGAPIPTLANATRSTEALCVSPPASVVVINDPNPNPPGPTPGGGGNTVPEPGTLLLLGAGIGVLGFVNRRRRSKVA